MAGEGARAGEGAVVVWGAVAVAVGPSCGPGGAGAVTASCDMSRPAAPRHAARYWREAALFSGPRSNGRERSRVGHISYDVNATSQYVMCGGARSLYLSIYRCSYATPPMIMI